MKRLTALASAVAALSLVLSCASTPAKTAAVAPSPAAETPVATPALVATPAPAADIVDELQPYAAATKACREAIAKAAALSSQGKWESAYAAIDDFDKANADPFALAMKTSLVLRGAVRSELHRTFGLTDLEEGQDLDTLRNSEGEYVPLAFDPVALADAQASKGIAAPGILSKELGDYYFEVIGRFSGQWALSDEEILAKIVENYAKAYDAGVFDGASLINHAETLVRLDRGDESDSIYAKALELDPESPRLLYSYAMSLSYRGKGVEALPLVDKAIAAYGEDSALINAVALGARTAADLGDDSKVQSYFAIADGAYPDSPTPGILRHTVALENGNTAAAEAAADGLADDFGSDPNVIRTLISTWYSAGDATAARDFLQRNITKGGDDMKVATLEFYLAVLLSQDSPSSEDKAMALVALDEAETRFKAALGDESEVYGIIAEIRAALQPQEPAPAQ